MTTVQGGSYTTGAANNDAEIRRRNVVSQDTANGGHVYKVEAEDVKKLKKVRCLPQSEGFRSYSYTVWERCRRDPRRVRVYNRSFGLYSIRAVYEIMEDWLVSYRHVG